jgi:hypothetical protein
MVVVRAFQMIEGKATLIATYEADTPPAIGEYLAFMETDTPSLVVTRVVWGIKAMSDEGKTKVASSLRPIDHVLDVVLVIVAPVSQSS